MADDLESLCPECAEQPRPPAALDRRDFLRAAGAAALAAGTLGAAGPRLAAGTPVTPSAGAARTAEALVQEFIAGLSADQRRQVVLPWDHTARGSRTPTRLRMTDVPFTRRIGELLSQPQQELVERILRALCAGEDGYRQLSRNGSFDDPNGVRSIGINLFGDPAGDNRYACVLTGHHLTVRCYRNSEPDAAFGGPMYFGHVVHGYSRRNCYFYHTRALMDVFDGLSERQRRQAVVRGNPGDFEVAARFRAAGQRRPGIPAADLTADQRRQVEEVMRTLMSPFRAEDAARAMQFVRRNGGVEQIHLAFYEEGRARAGEPWSSWRLEGPGFVWNVRVLPHVHTYVNIGANPA
jgi:hypothetical protein